MTTDLVARDQADVDVFFLVEGELLLCLIAVAGKAANCLRDFAEFIVGDSSSLLGCSNPASV